MRRFVQFSFQTEQRKNTYENVRDATRLGRFPGIHPVSNLWSEAVREYVKSAGQQVGIDSRFFNNFKRDEFGNPVSEGTTDKWVIVPELSQADLAPISEALREKLPFLLAENDVEITEPIFELGIEDTKTLADWMVGFFQSGIEVVSEKDPAVKDPEQIPGLAPEGEPWRALIAEVQMWGQSPRGLTNGGQNGDQNDGGFFEPPDVGSRRAGIGNSTTFIIGSAAVAASIMIIGASS